MKQVLELLGEFRPTLFFLGKFVLFYFIGNLVYGAYVTWCHPRPDPVTEWVTIQSSMVLNATGHETRTQNHSRKPTTYILNEGRAIVAVYEGCNGLNVMIVFLSFVLAFGPISAKLVWFLPLGLLVIHGSNLLRIVLLYIVSMKLPQYLYFTHKYLFTAFIYFFVFVLWIVWVRMKLKN